MASDTFVAVIPAVVFIVVVLPSASLVTPKVFALVPRIAMLWNFAEDTIASIESLTEIASAFNAAVSDASFVEFVSAIPIYLNLVANAANSISADSALKSKSNATCVDETTC